MAKYGNYSFSSMMGGNIESISEQNMYRIAQWGNFTKYYFDLEQLNRFYFWNSPFLLSKVERCYAGVTVGLETLRK